MREAYIATACALRLHRRLIRVFSCLRVASTSTKDEERDDSNERQHTADNSSDETNRHAATTASSRRFSASSARRATVRARRTAASRLLFTDRTAVLRNTKLNALDQFLLGYEAIFIHRGDVELQAHQAVEKRRLRTRERDAFELIALEVSTQRAELREINTYSLFLD